ncbi:MAG: glycosyltransferase family 4 protein [Bacteroidota bacterium]
MKLLVCHNYYKKTSGEDLVIASDLEILRKNGIECVEYSRSNSETDGYSLMQKISFFMNTIYNFKTVRGIELLIEKEKPDVALVQNVFPLISPSVYHALHRLQIPIVQLVYNYRFICPNAILYTNGKICERCVGGNYAHAINNKCYRNSFMLSSVYAASIAIHRHLGKLSSLISAYVTPDLFLKNKLGKGKFPMERMFSVLNPFDVEKYTPDYSHKNYFVYFGRLVREKGIFTLLKVMKEIPAIKLVVVGGGEAEIEAWNFARNNNLQNVEFTGPKYGDELIAILSNATAIVVPTEWYDNSPLVVHQSFALGKPVIASNIDGIPEIIEHNRDGLLFSPGNVSELKEKIIFLQNNEDIRLQLGKNARAKAETLFTKEKRFENLMRIIKFALQNPI